MHVPELAYNYSKIILKHMGLFILLSASLILLQYIYLIKYIKLIFKDNSGILQAIHTYMFLPGTSSESGQ